MSKDDKDCEEKAQILLTDLILFFFKGENCRKNFCRRRFSIHSVTFRKIKERALRDNVIAIE